MSFDAECGNGWRDGSSCLCRPDFTLDSTDRCTVALDWDSAAALYSFFLWLMRVMFPLLCVMTGWRAVQLIRHRARHTWSRQGCSVDSQLGCLILISAGMAVDCVFSVDPMGYEGIFSRKTAISLDAPALAFDLAGASCMIRFFVSIQSKWSPRTRAWLPVFDVFTVVMTLLVLALLAPLLLSSVNIGPVIELYGVLASVWIFSLVIGTALYSVRILRVAQRSIASSAASAALSEEARRERVASANRLVQIARAVCAFGICNVLLAIGSQFTGDSINNTPPRTAVGFQLGYRVLEAAGMVAVALLMGRTRSEHSVHPDNTNAAAGAAADADASMGTGAAGAELNRTAGKSPTSPHRAFVPSAVSKKSASQKYTQQSGAEQDPPSIHVESANAAAAAVPV